MSLPADGERTKWVDRPAVRIGLGRFLIGPYMRLLKATSRVVTDPPDFWQQVLDNWPVSFRQFIKVMPIDYKAALEKRKEEKKASKSSVSNSELKF